MRHARIIEEIHRHSWAITPAAMDAIVRIVSNGEELEDRSIFHGSTITVEDRKAELSANYPGEDAEAYRYSERRGNIGIMHMDGPIIPRDAGQAPSQPKLTTVQGLMSDLAAMEADPKIDRVAIMSDSPGGAVTGISELAAQIENMSKPVATYVEGLGASAAYWIASASDAIVGANTANVGSIGVVARVASGKNKDSVEIISSQSEFKHPDPETDAGKSVYQAMVNDTADVFINAVAENRNTNREDVLENFGKGAVMIAARAKAKGMIDDVMTRAEFMRQFSGNLEACSFMKGTKSRKRSKLFGINKVDISAGNVELEGNDTAPRTAVVNPNEGAVKMDLKQFLEENPTARADIDEMIATAKAEAVAALRADLGIAAKVCVSSEMYSPAIRVFAGDVIVGKRTTADLSAVMAVFEMESERAASQAAQDATVKIGTTPANAQAERSNDGKIRTTADFMAAISKKEAVQ